MATALHQPEFRGLDRTLPSKPLAGGLRRDALPLPHRETVSRTTRCPSQQGARTEPLSKRACRTNRKKRAACRVLRNRSTHRRPVSDLGCPYSTLSLPSLCNAPTALLRSNETDPLPSRRANVAADDPTYMNYQGAVVQGVPFALKSVPQQAALLRLARGSPNLTEFNDVNVRTSGRR